MELQLKSKHKYLVGSTNTLLATTFGMMVPLVVATFAIYRGGHDSATIAFYVGAVGFVNYFFSVFHLIRLRKMIDKSDT